MLPRKVLLLGSGGLSIGQAGEFDYSGTQAARALKKEGIEVVVINPNIATVQTNPEPGITVYLYPVEPHWVEKIAEIEKPDAILASFGGQTALNCVLKMEEQGILKRLRLKNLGTPLSSFRATEDRALFSSAMKKIGVPTPPSASATSVNEAIHAARTIGFPLISRSAFALGGLGSGFAEDTAHLRSIVEVALASSPQVLLEKSLRGWKEVEYEIMRDRAGNKIAICNMENFDPMGIHTGDSIVVAPSQTLSDDEYQMLRDAAFRIVEHFEIIGECNVQFALSPHSLEYYVIEINARLSRSSALASKATGYPIASIAAQVVLGRILPEIRNPMTGVTSAFYEPAMDYLCVKIPRWDLVKFRGVDRRIGSAMKSVGEVMAIGRSFPEALQKAIRMVTEHPEGISAPIRSQTLTQLKQALKEPTDNRLFELAEGFRMGLSVGEIQECTRIDPWFLFQLESLIMLEREIASCASKDISATQWKSWKKSGFGDEQIAGIRLRALASAQAIKSAIDLSERSIREASIQLRQQRMECGIRPYRKKIDTTAAEYPAASNYLYLTYHGLTDDPVDADAKTKSAVILGGGTYRIGTSVEFDWCAVACSRKLKSENWRSILINCNPETVSTDYDASDRLYFEEVSLERLLDIHALEAPNGWIVSMGGQLPNRLARPMSEQGLILFGHSAPTIEAAENRETFSRILDQSKIDQPRWISATNHAEVQSFVERVGFPVLVRPSFVLSGAAMTVATDSQSLAFALSCATEISRDYPVVLTEFISNAHEIEFDGVAKHGEIIVHAISEHIENAGIHSGDATLITPPARLSHEHAKRLHETAQKIAAGLELNGPFNIQFILKGDRIQVIECNARASRSFPFVSKVHNLPFAEIATNVMINAPIPSFHSLTDTDRIGVKASVFSFNRLAGADPILGVEMTSTGEVGCIGATLNEALLLAFEGAGIRRPKIGILVSSGTQEEKSKLLAVFQTLNSLQIPIYATPGTAKHMQTHGISVTKVSWPDERSDSRPNACNLIREKKVDLVINVPKSFDPVEIQRDATIRRAAVQSGCALITDIEKATAFFKSFDFANYSAELKSLGASKQM